MGYARFSRKKIRARLPLALRGARDAAVRSESHAEGWNCSWGEVKAVSVFLQEIVIDAVFQRCNPKGGCRFSVMSGSEKRPFSCCTSTLGHLGFGRNQMGMHCDPPNVLLVSLRSRCMARVECEKLLGRKVR